MKVEKSWKDALGRTGEVALGRNITDGLWTDCQLTEHENLGHFHTFSPTAVVPLLHCPARQLGSDTR